MARESPLVRGIKRAGAGIKRAITSVDEYMFKRMPKDFQEMHEMRKTKSKFEKRREAFREKKKNG